MIKTISLLATILILWATPSCNNEDKKKEWPSGEYLGVYADSGKVRASIIIREVRDIVKVDSITGEKTITTQVLHGVNFPAKYKTTSGELRDTIFGRVLSNDSINLNVEGIPLKDLLDKSKWKKQ